VDDPKRWMDFARTDLRMASEGIKHGYRLEPLCYHAQQAAEKALKALLVARRVPFPKVHDLKKLMALLPPDLYPPREVRAATDITQYSEAGRYPQGFEDVTQNEYRHAVELAKGVFDWVEKVLAQEKHSGPQAQEKPAPYRAPKRGLKRKIKVKK
jgi:HEPN domain-containing protein